jgi:hypothetical protein
MIPKQSFEARDCFAEMGRLIAFDSERIHICARLKTKLTLEDATFQTRCSGCERAGIGRTIFSRCIGRLAMSLLESKRVKRREIIVKFTPSFPAQMN